METSLKKDSLTQSIQKVTVFMRNYKKHAYALTVDTILTCRSLKHLISVKVQNSIKNLAVFYKGKLIEDSQNLITLQENGILHVINVSRTLTPDISISFRLHKEPDRLFKIKALSKAIIRDVLQNQLKPLLGKGENQVFLVYVGKPLNIFKKFFEQYVEDQSEIMIVQFKNKANVEPRQVQHIEEINHTTVLKAASVASTKMNFAPAIGTMNSSNQYSITKYKPSLNKKAQPKIQQAAPQQQSSPFFKQKNEDKKLTKQVTAPGGQISKYTGFDPHKQSAPGLEFQLKKVIVPHDPNFKQLKEDTVPANPQTKGLIFKEEDFIFAGHASLLETQNIIPGSIQQAKQNLLKKKKSGKEYF